MLLSKQVQLRGPKVRRGGRMTPDRLTHEPPGSPEECREDGVSPRGAFRARWLFWRDALRQSEGKESAPPHKSSYNGAAARPELASGGVGGPQLGSPRAQPSVLSLAFGRSVLTPSSQKTFFPPRRELIPTVGNSKSHHRNVQKRGESARRAATTFAGIGTWWVVFSTSAPRRKGAFSAPDQPPHPGKSPGLASVVQIQRRVLDTGRG